MELAQVPNGSSVLDVATGRGAVLFPAADAAGSGGKFIGIDLSDEMIAEIAVDIDQRGLGKIEVVRMDAEELKFADTSYDCVFCGLSIFAFPRPNHALAEMRRVLEPGGRLGLNTVWRIFSFMEPVKSQTDFGRRALSRSFTGRLCSSLACFLINW